ncbi:efflux RND transporter permease subunit [Candidatus Nitronereus thalassa]|uniref:MMPL family transporter n=1 Tax=Candidatus Nitronereus thalassa TaxID=3020898 RepID=A0ABU3K3I6_9BACT|nr:MMPL family transporter [Candidatus Nitronereus thalassa]MDT7040953.1 MMPL family transporter [Candidatus Nitronereus thalassa]
MESRLLRVYKSVVIDRPIISIGILFLLVGFFAVQGQNLKLDASAESIVLENDQDLKYYRASREVYGSDDFLIITYTPPGDLFSPESLAGLKALRDDLAKLDKVKTVLSILDVPLVNSPKVTIAELTDEGGVRTLESPGVDVALARKEFLESPIYQNNLVSLDGKTTAIQVIFKEDLKYSSLLKRRNQLREQAAAGELSAEESGALESAIQEFNAYHAHFVEAGREDIRIIRGILEKHRQSAALFLGGVRMITSDMISFIQNDIAVFGVGVIAFLIAALTYFFRKVRWVLLPLSCCLLSVSVMVGFLGFMDWRVTVISSNFISLLLIITMSLTIHLIVRYRIIDEEHPSSDQKVLVFETMRDMFKPCFYTAITTIVAFCSLIVSGIRPVIDFGWMMTIGITFAFILNFIYVPAVMVLLRPEKSIVRPDATRSFTMSVANFTLRNTTAISLVSVIVAIIGGIGITMLKVENRFIDHFKSTTEIYQGMELIDTKLGGTIPLEFILDADKEFLFSEEIPADQADPFEDPFGDEGSTEEVTYWFNGDRLNLIEKIHDYLDSLPEVGKVLSIATGMKVFKQLNDGRMPEDYELALLRKYVPEKVKEALIDPYLREDGNQVRITMRLIESTPELKRKELIDGIRAYLVNDVKLEAQAVHSTGMAVLYNNLLQSLFKSQILTLGVVFVSILLMFVVLFRSVALSILAILPNMLAACSVLGLMGWVGIPLDIMTITIAAITVGIAVDHAIHYIHRFQVEFGKHGNYRETILACHGSIGRAIYYTALTITVGFSILAFSSFIPTIYFGLLTGFAMMIALLSNLTLLAALLMVFKPLGAEVSPEMVRT